MTIELRRVTADDWHVWRPVRLAALAEAPGAFGSTLDDWSDAPEDRWRTRLSIPRALDLVAYDGSAPVGMASGVPGDEPGTVELISMWVDPVARGRGVASTLVQAIATWAAETGAHTLELSVMPDNAVARHTYERNDFVGVDEPGGQLPDGRHEVVMRRDLVAERTLVAYEHGAEQYVDRTDGDRSGLVDELLAMVTPGAHVLELGSGPGRDALALEDGGLVVDRTDGARSFVDALRAVGHAARVLDLRSDDFGGPYDAVFANAVLLHVARGDLGRVLTRVLAAVRLDGVLAATLKAGDGEGWSTRKLDHARYFTYWEQDTLAATVTGSGWADVVVRDTTRAGADERWLTVTARRPQEAGRP